MASASSVSHGRNSQENSTATQTESSMFSLTPHQYAGLTQSSDLSHRPNHQGSHTFSLTSSTGSMATHSSAHPFHPSSHAVAHSSSLSSSPHPSSHLTTSMFHSSPSGCGQWQVPLSAPLPSPNENSASGETPVEHSVNSMNSLPASQPESWAASSSIEQVAESPTPTSRPDSRSASNAGQANSGVAVEWAEPEHEEAMMDDHIEPILPVHDLAEADQSQGMPPYVSLCNKVFSFLKYVDISKIITQQSYCCTFPQSYLKPNSSLKENKYCCFLNYSIEAHSILH